MSGLTGAAPAPATPPPETGGRPPARPWWLGVAVIALGLVWLYGALSLPQAATYAVVGPGFFPAVIGAGLVVLGALAPRSPSPAASASSPRRRRTPT